MEDKAHEHYRYLTRLVESEARRAIQTEEASGGSVSPHDDPSDGFWYLYALGSQVEYSPRQEPEFAPPLPPNREATPAMLNNYGSLLELKVPPLSGPNQQWLLLPLIRAELKVT